MAEHSLSPVGEWDALNADRFYAREQLGEMQWSDIRLDEMRFAFPAPPPPPPRYKRIPCMVAATPFLDKQAYRHIGKRISPKDAHVTRRFACAAFGGPIAMVRDEAKATLVRGASTTTPVVRRSCHTFLPPPRELGVTTYRFAVRQCAHAAQA